MHTGARPHTCPAWGKAFRQNFDLAEPLKIRGVAQLHACPDWVKAFLHVAGLWQHQRTHRQEALRAHPVQPGLRRGLQPGRAQGQADG